MMHISGIMPSLEQQIERSRERVQRLRLLHPTIDCLNCMDTGLVEGGTHFVADDNERVTIQPKVEPCPMCGKGKEIQHERERAAWIERVNDEVGVPQEIQRNLEQGKVDHRLARKLRDSVDEHGGAYLFGGVGRGKSAAAAAALLGFVRSTGDVRRSPRRVGCFVTAADYLQGIRDSYNGERSVGLAGQQGVLASSATDTRLLVCDDLGAEYIRGVGGDSWALEQIETLIDHRSSAGLPTIFTSNLSLDQLEAKYNRVARPMGSRIASRIAGACEEIEVKGQDYRRKNRRAS